MDTLSPLRLSGQDIRKNDNVKAVKSFCIFIIVIATTFSCKEDTCTKTYVSNVNIKFYDSTFKAYSFYSISIYGMGRNDSLLYSKAVNMDSILVPLDQNSDESKFILDCALQDSVYLRDTIILKPAPHTVQLYKKLLKTFIDTLTIQYKRKIILISPQCGFVTIFELNKLGTSHNLIDSSLVSVPLIKLNSNEENIKIFF
jgi:hypothetical protein